jgi:hypothetical protein
MSRILILSLCAAFALLCVLAQQDDAALSCTNIGKLSGCSGCDTGSSGMCRYIGRKAKQSGKTTTTYQCKSSQAAASLVATKNSGWFYAGGLCPADSNSEGTYKTGVDTGSSDRRDMDETLAAPVGAKKASTVYSKSVKSDKVKFNDKDGKQTVDRTSSTQPLGGLNGDSSKRAAMFTTLPPLPNGLAPLTCQNLNSQHLSTAVDYFDGCSTGFVSTGGLSDAQRQCKALVFTTWAALLCPRYGVALAGVTQTLADHLTMVCATSGCNPVWPWDYFMNIMDVIVPDNTAYALNEIDEVGIEDVTSVYEAANGFYEAVQIVTPVDGLEVTSVQSNQPCFGPSTSYLEAIDLLSDPVKQFSKKTLVLRFAEFSSGFACRKRDGEGCVGKREAEVAEENADRQQLVGAYNPHDLSLFTDGGCPTVIQIVGQVYIPNPGWYPLTVSISGAPYWNVTVNTTHVNQNNNGISFPTEGGWLNILGIFYTNSDEISSLRIDINFDTVGVFWAVRTVSDAPIVEPPVFEGKGPKT